MNRRAFLQVLGAAVVGGVATFPKRKVIAPPKELVVPQGDFYTATYQTFWSEPVVDYSEHEAYHQVLRHYYEPAIRAQLESDLLEPKLREHLGLHVIASKWS